MKITDDQLRPPETEMILPVNRLKACTPVERIVTLRETCHRTLGIALQGVEAEAGELTIWKGNC